ncbi:MAG TPA: tetratricopeptide repeat protein [Flavobacteriales bacterium]
MIRTLLLVLFAAGATLAFTQPTTDEQIAAQYFQQGDHEKAVLYYEKLHRKQPTPYYYEQLFKSYIALKRYDDATKLVKDQLRRTDDDGRYLVDLGHLYKLQDEPDKSLVQYEKAVKGLKEGDQNAVRQLANAFTKYNEYDRALDTYQRGQKLLKSDAFSFHYEIANLYAMKGDMDRMVGSYMDLLSSNPSYLQSVQNALARYIDFTTADVRTETLRMELLRRIQKEPQNTLFQEMLIWVYLQQNDLGGAFVQSKAMDKRFNEGGYRLMELAEIAVTNKDWNTATKCYQYVVDLGAGNANYNLARVGMVEAMDARITGMSDPPAADLQTLQQQYNTTITEMGNTPATAELMIGLARLKAYYLNDRAGAMALFEEVIGIPGLDPKKQAAYKLELGDVHVLGGDIWEASLLYSQVDLEYKQDILGHEARLRNAKVSYYAGDFLWAKAQLDVLKASTSKLIANDAMELSLLISDNLSADSLNLALKAFAQAELLTFQHRYDDALTVLDSLGAAFPLDPLGDDILYMRYRIAFARHLYPEAAGYLEKVLELYPNDILVDNAMLDLGKLYELQLKDNAKAMAWYEKLLFEQSGSIFTPEARQRFRRLRGDHDNLDTPEQKFLNGTP